MKRPHSLAAALLWSGLALILLPFAIAFVFLAAVVLGPQGYVIVGGLIVFVIVRALVSKKGSPE